MPFNTRSCPAVNAFCGTSCPVSFALAGIKEKRVEEVAAVATQTVINPTPATTCPATKEEGLFAEEKITIPEIMVTTAAR